MAIVPQAQNPIASRLHVIAAMPPRRKLGLMIGIAAALALLAGVWIWEQTPDYRVLFSNLGDRDGGAILAALQQQNVPYKVAEGGGAILVPAGQVHEVRMRLASQGLPKGSIVGFELMENQKLGISQFQEQVNYQRSLEGELARSVQSISAVQSARVHLAIPKPSVFLREQQKPSASVLVHLHSGQSLDAGQVSAIVHLVSNSVAGLPEKNVTVLDQKGNLLTGSDSMNGSGKLNPGQLRYRHEVEESYIKRIEAILAPILGAENIRAQVTADLDFNESEQTAESYKPNSAPAEAAIRSHQKLDSVDPGPGNVGGVPGALSNQPPAPATAPIVAPGGGPTSQGAARAPVSTRNESTINYEVDKTIRHVKGAVGAVKRLSVAVVVNHRQIAGADGKATPKPLSQEEVAQLSDLVKEAVGYSKDRGDTLNVVNSAFNVTEQGAAAELPLWQQPETLSLAKDVGKHLLVALVVLILALFVLRPLLKNLGETQPVASAVEPENSGAQMTETSQPSAIPNLERRLQAAKDIARHDPKIVANVVKSWVNGDER